jgi:hypothetical protein
MPGARRQAHGASSSPATPDEAKAFVQQVDKDLRRLWVARDRAGWANQNFITDDTEALAASGEEATAAYVTEAIQKARRFDGVKTDPVTARQLLLLKLAQTVPAPSNADERRELAEIQSSMQGTYGKGEYCPPAGSPLLKQAAPGKKCLKLDDLSRAMKKSRSYDEQLEAWKGWHAIAPAMKDKYARYADLGNKGAKEIGFADMGALWRSVYDMPPDAFEADIERLWSDVKPLYDDLHCYARKKLRAKYGKDKVPRRRRFQPTFSATCGRSSGTRSTTSSSRSLGKDHSTSTRSSRKEVRRAEDGAARRGVLHVARARSAPEDVLGALALHAAEGSRGRLSRERVGSVVERRLCGSRCASSRPRTISSRSTTSSVTTIISTITRNSRFFSRPVRTTAFMRGSATRLPCR